MRHLLAALCVLGCWCGAAAADLTVKIAVAPGLKFFPPRFAAAPGDRVRVLLTNGDDMIHNLVITAPGERLKVVSAALGLGADGPGRNFVPPLPEVLWSTRALNPGETATLEFTAPAAEGVYPYVCTFPGHGFVMYGAMYVTRGALPPLASDDNVPPAAAESAHARSGLLVATDHPLVSRTFLPDCGPAAIAVGLPGGQSYCFDADECRLRYAWKGGFVDNTDQWEGKGDLWSQVEGRIYYRAPAERWLRLGRADRLPVPRWGGYRLVEGYPEFLYTLDGIEVRELIRPLAAGGGLTFAYEIPAAPAGVFFVAPSDGGGRFTASAGTWRGGELALTAAEASHFTVTLTERPGVEPLRYWSMNDALWSSESAPPPGVVGGAFRPGGGQTPPHVLDAEAKPSQLAQGGTLMAWVKADPAAGPAPVFSCGSGWIAAAPRRDGHWHHLAWVFPPGADGRLFVDGVEQGDPALRLPAADDDFAIGSTGERFLEGLLDEVRIYDRAVSGPEIAKLYRREAAAGGLLAP